MFAFGFGAWCVCEKYSFYPYDQMKKNHITPLPVLELVMYAPDTFFFFFVRSQIASGRLKYHIWASRTHSHLRPHTHLGLIIFPPGLGSLVAVPRAPPAAQPHRGPAVSRLHAIPVPWGRCFSRRSRGPRGRDRATPDAPRTCERGTDGVEAGREKRGDGCVVRDLWRR